MNESQVDTIARSLVRRSSRRWLLKSIGGGTVAVGLGLSRSAEVTAAGLTLELSVSATKAKVGDEVTYTAWVQNTGTEPITELRLSFNLPDALDAQSLSCPGIAETVTDCQLDTLAAGESRTVLVVVRVGSRNRQTNGDVTTWTSSGGAVLASARLPQLKIVGSPR